MLSMLQASSPPRCRAILVPKEMTMNLMSKILAGKNRAAPGPTYSVELWTTAASLSSCLAIAGVLGTTSVAAQDKVEVHAFPSPYMDAKDTPLVEIDKGAMVDQATKAYWDLPEDSSTRFLRCRHCRQGRRGSVD